MGGNSSESQRDGLGPGPAEQLCVEKSCYIVERRDGRVRVGEQPLLKRKDSVKKRLEMSMLNDGVEAKRVEWS